MPVHYERLEGRIKDMKHLGENSSDSDDTVNDTDFDEILAIRSTTSMAQPEYFDQSELIDLALGLGLSKELTELLASTISEKHILKSGTNVSFYWHREKEFRRYFHEDSVFVTCTDIR